MQDLVLEGWYAEWSRLRPIALRDVHASHRWRAVPKRFGKYGLTLHPDKTRLVAFHRPKRDDDGDDGPGSFDLLGFTHHWAKDRFSRALRRVRDWCRLNRHADVETQHRALSQKLNGHYSYFGVTGNLRMIGRLHNEVVKAWHKWLSRRSQRGMLNWDKMNALLKRHPLPRPRIVHRYT